MNTYTSLSTWRAHRATLQDKKISFVPTMGNLHEGHLALCRAAKENQQYLVVSIFVNPTQFNQASDFEKYPRTLEADLAKLQSVGVDAVLLPGADELYPDQYTVQISEHAVATLLEGEYRPGHFTGMLSIVLKLLNIVQPHKAYFGEKDYQQLYLVKKMCEALFVPVEIIGCETIRNENGLALSSRNSRLSEAALMLAPTFHELLSSSFSCDVIKAQLQQHGFEVDYIAEQWGRRLGAVWLEGVRLIDNIAWEN